MHREFFNRKKFYSMLLQGMCNSEIFSEMFVQKNLMEYMMLVNYTVWNVYEAHETKDYT